MKNIKNTDSSGRRKGPRAETLQKCKDVAAAIKNGATVQEACLQHSMCRKYYDKIVKKYNLERVAPSRTNQGRLKGERHGMSVLTEEEVRLIKKLIEDGFSYTKIAEKFEVSKSLISHIKTGRAWKHLDGMER